VAQQRQGRRGQVQAAAPTRWALACFKFQTPHRGHRSARRIVMRPFLGRWRLQRAPIVDFERSLILERTTAGRTPAKSRGVRFGRKPSLTGDQVTAAKSLIAGGKTTSQAAEDVGVHRATLYRALAAR